MLEFSIFMWAVSGFFTAMWNTKEDKDGGFGIGHLIIWLFIFMLGWISMAIYAWDKHIKHMEK